MRKAFFAIAAGVVMAFSATQAHADTLGTGASYYIGSVDPGSPADVDMETWYINYLLDMSAPSTADNINPLPNPPNTEYDFVRSGNACTSLGGCVDAVSTGAVQVDTGSTTNLGDPSFLYLLAKYGNTAYVWYVGGLSEVIVASNIAGEQNGLSHYALFNVSNVPDGGSTLTLLGLGMLGLGYLKRSRA